MPFIVKLVNINFLLHATADEVKLFNFFLWPQKCNHVVYQEHNAISEEFKRLREKKVYPLNAYGGISEILNFLHLQQRL